MLVVAVVGIRSIDLKRNRNRKQKCKDAKVGLYPCGLDILPCQSWVELDGPNILTDRLYKG